MTSRAWTGRLAALLLALPASTTSCADGGDRPEAGGGTIDRPAPELVRIRAVEARGGFGRIEGLAVDTAGRVWILDGLKLEIVVYDTLGRRIMVVGREGEGPGELTDPLGLFADRSGRIWVSDLGNARYSAFDFNGRLVEERRREVVGRPFHWQARHLGDDAYLESGAGRWGRFWAETVFLLDGSMSKRDSIRVGESLATFDIPDDARFSVPIPWRTEYLWAPGEAGTIWRGHTRPYVLANVTMSGDTLQLIRRQGEPRPVAPGERDSALAVLDSVTGLRISSQADLVPETKPPITGLHTSEEGDLWVRRWWEGGGHGSRFDVYFSDGRLRGTVTVDVRIEPPIAVRGDRLYAVVRDELDVASVTVRRVTGLDHGRP